MEEPSKKPLSSFCPRHHPVAAAALVVVAFRTAHRHLGGDDVHLAQIAARVFAARLEAVGVLRVGVDRTRLCNARTGLVHPPRTAQHIRLGVQQLGHMQIIAGLPTHALDKPPVQHGRYGEYEREREGGGGG